MIRIFNGINPKDDILRKNDIFNYFSNIFAQKYSNYDEKILKSISRKCVRMRVDRINEIIEMNKRKSETAPNSARGARKQIDFTLA